MKERKRTLLKAVLAMACFHLLFFALFTSTHNSIEDVYASYMLSGAFGNKAGNLLHYNYLLHPLLTLPAWKLFGIFPGVNWYTIMLVSGNFIAGTVLVWLLLQQPLGRLRLAFMVGSALLFQAYCLSIIDFTNTSIHLAVAGMAFMVCSAYQGQVTVKRLVAGGVLLLLASMFRVHSMLPVILVSAPFFLLSQKKYWLKCATGLVVTALVILAFNQLQQSWYTNADAGWPREELVRDKVFYMYNYQSIGLENSMKGSAWELEAKLVDRALLIDTSLLSPARLDSMIATQHVERSTGIMPGNDWLYWFFVNNRIFMLFTLFTLAVFITTPMRLLAAGLSILLALGFFVYLFSVNKFPGYILVSVLYSISIIPLLTAAPKLLITRRFAVEPSIILLAIGFAAWGCYRLHSMGLEFSSRTALFRKNYKFISGHADKLFISSETTSIDRFPVFSSPLQYPLPNYLDSENFLLKTYEPALHRYGIWDITGILNNEHVVFWGVPQEGLQLYLKVKLGREVEVVPAGLSPDQPQLTRLVSSK